MASLPDLTSQEGPAWPAMKWEELVWTPAMAGIEMSRAEAARQTGPYRAALPPRIATRSVQLSAEVAAEVSEASTEIARFDSEMGREIAAFAAILLRSEAAASSQIEHLTASARSIATAELGETAGRNASDIVANTQTMIAALASADQLDANSLLAMHAALMVARPNIAGRWRTQQVWIGRGLGGPRLADFVPPQHSHVESLIDDLVTFIAREDIPPLAQSAIAHAQFETIHPFVDGNGRVGRAVIHAMLRAKRLTRSVTVPVSAGFLADIDNYFQALTDYREGDPGVIIQLMTAASYRALGNGRELVTDLRMIRENWNTKLSGRRDSAVWRAADIIVRKPVINHDTLRQELGSTNPDRYLRALTDAGILTEFSGKKRNRLWRSPEVLGALDAFAQRAGRR
jgi:Fic family protein